MLRAPATSSQALPAASAGTPTPCCAGMNSTLNVSAPAQPLPPSTCGATTDSKLATAGLHDALGRRTDLLRRARYASRSQTQAPAPALTVCVSVSGCTSSVVCREGRQWAGDVSQPRGRVLLLAREGYIRVPPPLIQNQLAGIDLLHALKSGRLHVRVTRNSAERCVPRAAQARILMSELSPNAQHQTMKHPGLKGGWATSG